MNGSMGDEGLYGTGSATWQLMDSPLMWVAAARALYLQALHPQVMRATWQHANFTDPDDAWARLRRTERFIMARTYGTVAEAERAGARVRKIHASLTGTEPDGAQFRLDRPDLLLWVHCAEVASVADVARRAGLHADLDAFVAEQRRSAALVGLEAETVPGSMSELRACMQGVRPALRACDEARMALRLSFRPPVPDGSNGLRLGIPPFSALAFATLPSWARRMYGGPADPVTSGAATAILRAAHHATPVAAKRRLSRAAVRAVQQAEAEALGS